MDGHRRCPVVANGLVLSVAVVLGRPSVLAVLVILVAVAIVLLLEVAARQRCSLSIIMLFEEESVETGRNLSATSS